MRLEIRNNGTLILNGQQTNFKAQEFLPANVYNHPTRNPLWYLDPETVSLAQFYRDWWEVPVYLNNWHRGGSRNLAGFRTPESGIIDHLKEEGMADSEARNIMNKMLSIEGFDKEKLTTGSWWSTHKMKIAIDPKIEGVSADRARQEIKDNEQQFMEAGLTTLESGRFAPTWVHSDRRPTGLDEILIVGA